ncbi:hypothetical protein B0T16DRAFT_414493 [Cercophora newfieldiana]|uniref:Uncharacterized protein n=1 Tax=Cercophora newfieldiana TaxID=92897 RepID=A0AA39Y6H6_9PEZI|nr:hypothetical protein B0T16DRAFT_414493 [Cercophora newfieldiana]
MSVSADITCLSQLGKAIARIKERFGSIDVLVNNAGIDRIGSLHCEHDFSVWWRVVEVNLKGSMACIHHVLPQMIQNNRGVIINIGSRNAISTYRFMTAYSAAKTALLRTSQCLQLNIKDTDVDIFFVQPSNVATALADGTCNAAELEESPELQAYMDHMRQSMTGGESDSPQLVANTCIFLAAHPEARLLRGLYLDAKQDMGQLLAEAAKGDGSRIKLERLQYLKADLL